MPKHLPIPFKWISKHIYIVITMVQNVHLHVEPTNLIWQSTISLHFIQGLWSLIHIEKNFSSARNKEILPKKYRDISLLRPAFVLLHLTSYCILPASYIYYRHMSMLWFYRTIGIYTSSSFVRCRRNHYSLCKT